MPVRRTTYGCRVMSPCRRGPCQISHQDRLAHLLVMAVASLELLVDRVHVAQTALKPVGAEHGGGAGHVIGDIDDLGRLMDGRGRRQPERNAMRFGEGAVHETV